MITAETNNAHMVSRYGPASEGTPTWLGEPTHWRGEIGTEHGTECGRPDHRRERAAAALGSCQVGRGVAGLERGGRAAADRDQAEQGEREPAEAGADDGRQCAADADCIGEHQAGTAAVRHP